MRGRVRSRAPGSVVPFRQVFHDFLIKNRGAILARTREKVAARPAPRATEEELQNGIPLFLDQLIETLRVSRVSTHAMAECAARHGRDLFERGFTVAQVVHDYGGVSQAVTEVASETKAPITVADFHAFHECLDEAIAQAVTEYTVSRERSIVGAGAERLGNLSHELRNALGAATLSFQTLKTGRVGMDGRTAAVLDRSLRRACALVDSSIAQVRLEAHNRAIERISINQFMEEIEIVASMEAAERGLTLAVKRAAPDVKVEVDRELLAGALMNLLQNAFKFTRPQGHVSITTTASADRVLIAVEDQCGGLPSGKADELFRPFEQKSANRTGLGLGLSISRRSVEALDGELRVRDIPGTGCVFTIDLPRFSPAG